MLHEALKRAGHVVPASEITVRTRRAPRPLRPWAFAIVLGVVCVVSAAGAVVLYRTDPTFASFPLLRQIAAMRFEAVAQAPPEAASEPRPEPAPIVEPSPAWAPPPPAPVAAPPAEPVLAAPALPPAEIVPAVTTTPTPPAPATVPAATGPAPETRLLLTRGDSLLRSGDLAAARLFYQRAAEQGDAAGALGVAKTYDPLFLEQSGFRHLRGDTAAAERWYAQAEAAGDVVASERLARLRATGPR